MACCQSFSQYWYLMTLFYFWWEEIERSFLTGGYWAFPIFSVKNPPSMQEMQESLVKSLGGEDALEEEMATVFLLEKSHK